MLTLTELTTKLTEAVRSGEIARIEAATRELTELAQMQQHMGRSVMYLANITEQQWLRSRTYGNFLVHPCPPGAEYSLTSISARKDAIDVGDGRKIDFWIPASAIAEDLAMDINGDAGEPGHPSNFGVFVCDGETPTAIELAAARARLEEFYKRQVFIADQEWERSHNHRFISDIQRRASRHLKLEREWCYEVQSMVECPVCTERLRPNAAMCRHCGAIIRPDVAAKHGIGKAESAAVETAEQETAPAPARQAPQRRTRTQKAQA